MSNVEYKINTVKMIGFGSQFSLLWQKMVSVLAKDQSKK
jgi:hypothetical protein